MRKIVHSYSRYLDILVLLLTSLGNFLIHILLTPPRWRAGATVKWTGHPPITLPSPPPPLVSLWTRIHLPCSLPQSQHHLQARLEWRGPGGSFRIGLSGSEMYLACTSSSRSSALPRRVAQLFPLLPCASLPHPRQFRITPPPPSCDPNPPLGPNHKFLSSFTKTCIVLYHCSHRPISWSDQYITLSISISEQFGVCSNISRLICPILFNSYICYSDKLPRSQLGEQQNHPGSNSPNSVQNCIDLHKPVWTDYKHWRFWHCKGFVSQWMYCINPVRNCTELFVNIGKFETGGFWNSTK